MDSPVVVDTASKFGRGLDLDTSFPGFPFDDEGFPRRGEFRAHLDDLAARHPEFADQLLGPPWGDIPFQGSTLRNRRRGSGSGSSHQGHPDDDARSQASGSSAASGGSAGSGASGVSSHGEPEVDHGQRQSYNYESRRNPIPQYGLRNTVDIGQHHHNMENSDKGPRGQRSMSAPPENRQPGQAEQSAGQQTQPQGQRYVSRVDITPQHNQPQQQQPQTQQKPQQQQQQPQQKSQQQSNVRHIPIFVEGRDEPVIPKNVDDAPFRREPSPTQFHSTPHHFRSSPFGQSFGGRQHQWSPQFQDHFPQRETFYQPQSTFEQPTRRHQSQAYQQPRQQYSNRQHPEQHYEQPTAQPQQKTHPQHQQQQQQPQQQQQQQPQPQPEPPKPKPALPKDPLERVALVQKEVDSLAEQVKQYTGNSRKDKQYMYLDEMLTRELIKLDDIETEGRDNVRQARKNAIRSIQETISLLESKATPPTQQQSVEDGEVQNDKTVEQNDETSAGATEEKMDVDQKQDEQTKEAIPLPPGPSSPTNKTAEETEMQQDVKNDSTEQPMKENSQQPQEQQQSTGEPMDTTSVKQPEQTPMDVQQSTESADNQGTADETKKENAPETASEEKTPEAPVEKKPEILAENKPQQAEEQKSVDGQEKMEVDGQAQAQAPSQAKSTPKKAKKSKKQAPVSEQPIPLPAPETTETNAK